MSGYPHDVGDFGTELRMTKLPAVYVLSTPNYEFIKIGKSGALKQRISNIQTSCPFDLTVWLTIRTPIPVLIEQHMHRMMAHCHARGEWFSPSGEDLDALLSFVSQTNENIRATIQRLQSGARTEAAGIERRAA
jgi:hypothetical protein